MDDTVLLKSRQVLIFLCLVCIILIGVRLYVQVTMIQTQGLQKVMLQQKISDLQVKEDALRAQILEFESYRSIASRAAAMGFKEADTSISL